jgi:hypothetical protein
MLNELKHLMGDSLYYLSIQNFFLEWKLKHVNEQRFKDSIEKITGKNWNWFFDQWLHDTRVLDYSIEKWSKKRKSDGSYNVKIEIKNLGNRYIPVFIQH